MQTKTYLFVTCLLSIITQFSRAQSNQKAFFGIGGGLDYGGLGIRAEFQPVNSVGIFGGFGYNLADPSYNVGLSCKLLHGKRITPTITAMYGYNAAIRIKYGYGMVDASSYYGPSVGAGCELYDENKKNKWVLEIFVPFRSSEFHNRYRELKDAGYKFTPDMLPVTFAIGYNFSVTGKTNKRISKSN